MVVKSYSKVRHQITLQNSLMLNYDFSDIQPADMDPENTKNELVPISYDPEYSSLMSLFRPICIAREYSLRVLKLTTEILDFNPSHYSVWKYRLDTLKHLDNLDLWKDEIEFLNQIGAENPKSYQIWLQLLIGITDKLWSKRLVIVALSENLCRICLKTIPKITIAGNTSTFF
jgi:hypothetical protein